MVTGLLICSRETHFEPQNYGKDSNQPTFSPFSLLSAFLFRVFNTTRLAVRISSLLTEKVQL